MKTHAQTSEELKNLGIFNNFEPWIVDTLSNILFENEEILHAFNSDLICYSGTRLEKNELGYLAICTNERVIFVKKTSFSGVKSEIVLIKNIQSFETKSNKITIKLGERIIVINISEKHLTRNFTLILGHATAGRTITLQEIKLENEQYNTHLLQIKQQKKEQAEKEMKAFEEGMRKIVKHKSFKWWFPGVIILIIIISIPHKNDTKTEQPTQQTYIPNPYDTYKAPSTESTTDTTSANNAAEEAIKHTENNCKTKSQVRKELTKNTGEVLYSICYNSFYIKIDKSKVQKILPVTQTSVDALIQRYEICKDATQDASLCCSAALDAHKEVSEQNIKSSISNDDIKAACEVLI